MTEKVIRWQVNSRRGEARSVHAALADIERCLPLKVQAVGQQIVDAKTGEYVGDLGNPSKVRDDFVERDKGAGS